MKIGCNIDSFRLSNKSFGQAVETLSKLGYDCVEPEVIEGRCPSEIHHFCPMISMDADPIKIKKMISSYGLEVSCLSAHTSLLETEFGVRYLTKALRFGHMLGAPMINTCEGSKPEELADEEAFTIMKHNLNRILRIAENLDMYLSVETHGIYTYDVKGLKKILSISDSDKLAINFDTGNVFIAGSDPVLTLKEVVDRVVHLHVKDVARNLLHKRGKLTAIIGNTTIGTGEVDIKGCIDVLKNTGFKGVLSVECVENGLKQSLSYLRSIL